MFGDACARAALHAGKCNGAVAVGDHEVVGGELGFLGVAAEGKERLAFMGAAHMDLAASKCGEIKDMGRLTEFEEQEVGRVHNIVARDLSDGDQPTLHPLGAWADLHALDHARGVARAHRGLVVGDAHDVCGAGGSGRELNLGKSQRSSGRCGDLARHADMTKAVTTVGGGFDFLPHFAVVSGGAAVERKPGGGEHGGLFSCVGGAIEIVVDPKHAGAHSPAE